MHLSRSRNTLESAGGILLVGHGSGERQGIVEFLETARLVSQLAADRVVETAFLEFAEPTIAEGFEALVARAARRVVVVPVLLFSAAHAQRDIPAAIAAAAARHPEVAVEQAEHLGCHEAIVAVSMLRHDQALAGQPQVCPDATALVMVGRGSRDPEATAEMVRFVELRGRLASAGHASACFIAMAEPSIECVLQQTIERGPQRVVVQPHLLFGGALLDRIEAVVKRFAQHHPQAQWLMTQHLGVSPLVGQALVDRASAARPAASAAL